MNIRPASLLIALIHVPRHASFIGRCLRDAFGVRLGDRPDEEHLRAAMEWLCRAQDATGGGGVSGGYSWLDGWQPPYPETTGYTIPTFLQYAAFSGDRSYIERAVRMGDWEIEVQHPTGGVRGGMGENVYPIVFNTGQVLLGWTALYRYNRDDKYLQAARFAADWLTDIQHDEGRWVKHTFNDVSHAYHSRVAWPMLEVFDLTRTPRYRHAAERNVRWVLSLANQNGWFSQMGFTAEEMPVTHTIAYTLRGLLECAQRLDGEIVDEIWTAVEKACERILMRYERRKRDPRGMPEYLPGTLGPDWASRDRWSCLTGDAQLAIVFIKLFCRNGDPRYLNAALKLIDQVKATQSLKAVNRGVRGAVAGSYPIWGTYTRFGYPNWAAKFLADAIMLAARVLRKLEEQVG